MMRTFLIGAVALATFTVAGWAVKGGAADAAKRVFTMEVRTMNVDLISRSSLNANGAGQSLSTVVRFYQLKTPQAFEQLDYTQLQTNDLDALKADLLATKDVVLRPDASASISESMNSDTEYVGVVAFFREAGSDSTWKLVVPKKQWKKTDPVKIMVRDSTLQLVGAAPVPVKRGAPQQSLPNPPKLEPMTSTDQRGTIRAN
jgi:type VI secretion system protein VasD